MNALLRLLRKQEKVAQKVLADAQYEVKRVRQAIRLFSDNNSIGKRTGRRRRRMSAATRKKMAASARKRWAAKKAQ